MGIQLTIKWFEQKLNLEGQQRDAVTPLYKITPTMPMQNVLGKFLFKINKECR